MLAGIGVEELLDHGVGEGEEGVDGVGGGMIVSACPEPALGESLSEMVEVVAGRHALTTHELGQRRGCRQLVELAPDGGRVAAVWLEPAVVAEASILEEMGMELGVEEAAAPGEAFGVVGEDGVLGESSGGVLGFAGLGGAEIASLDGIVLDFDAVFEAGLDGLGGQLGIAEDLDIAGDLEGVSADDVIVLPDDELSVGESDLHVGVDEE